MTDITTPKPTTDVGNKASTALRYLASNATGALTLFVALGSVSPDQQVDILKSAHAMYQASHDFVGAAANIWYIVFPIVGIWLGRMGVNSSGFGAMMDKIFKAAQSGNRDAQVAIVTAAASPDIGTQAIINPMLAAEPSTPATVASSVSALPPDVKEQVK